MLKINGLTKRYGSDNVANDHISMHVARGEVLGLLGPNGAGKTTLVNQLIGLIRPDSGSITVDGMDVVADPAAARRLCALQPQTQIPIDGLTPLDAIELTARIRGVGRQAAKSRAKVLIERLHLEQWAKTRGENLSGGIRRLTAFCMTCAAPAKVAVFDEPTNDVDPERRRLLWKQIRDLADEGTAVLLVTHNVLEAERSADRLAIIHQSKLIREGTPASFRSNGSDHMVLELILEPDIKREDIEKLPSEAVQTGRRIFCPIETGDVAQRVQWANALRQRRFIEEFSVNPPSLEEAYLQLVGAAGFENGNHNGEGQ